MCSIMGYCGQEADLDKFKQGFDRPGCSLSGWAAVM